MRNQVSTEITRSIVDQNKRWSLLNTPLVEINTSGTLQGTNIMGNNFSFWNQSWPPTQGWDILPRSRKNSLCYNFPTCSDELLDWCLQASKIFDIYSKRRVKKQEIDKDMSLFSNAVFVPYVLQESKSGMIDLYSMKRLDRMKFFGENVSTPELFCS